MQFAAIAGQSKVKQSLIQSAKDGRISHALLFAGPEGNGALPLAVAYIQYLFCKNRSATDSCGVCRECQQISKLSHPDVHFVYPLSLSRSKESSKSAESKSGGVNKSMDVFKQWREAYLQNPYLSLTDWMEFLEVENKQMVIGVDEAKDIIHQLSLTSFEGSYKVMIVWMAEKMNNTAANKILKVLEEPPDKTIFILITENSQLPVTVLSRTQLIRVPRIEEADMVNALVGNFGLTSEAALYMAQASEGNFRTARLLATEEEHSEFHFQKFRDWMRICMKLNAENIMEWIAEIAAIGRERQKQFIAYCLQALRQSMLVAAGGKVLLRPDEEEFLLKFAAYLPLDRAALIAEEMSKAYHAIGRNGNPKILLMSSSLTIHKLLN
ncbi:MAG: hypothetical protein HKL88_03625 [Bacteroidia bacterium]|jgi:DNA polymerase-3 subunit delta'|nr:hypothetical protein [Bacteroidia bacterium]